MNELFKLYRELPSGYVSNKNVVTKNISLTNAPIPVPYEGDRVNINILKDFKWTKTLKEGRVNIPTLRLTEMYVNRPAFFSNIARYVDLSRDTVNILKNIGTQIIQTDTLGSILSKLDLSGLDILTGGTDLASKYLDLVENSIKNVIDDKSTETTTSKHLKSIEDLYGVNITGFKYILPYLEQDWKQISNTWGEDSLTSSLIPGGVTNIIRAITTGIGLDFAKTYNYNTEGPEQNVAFFLDNTWDSHLDGNAKVPWQMNWQFIFLLLYQNLPNRLNISVIEPPVIYRAMVPGVFYYRYSYLSRLEVINHGNRQSREVTMTVDGEQKQYTTIIPEAFEIKMTLRSLLPESKNLMFESFENNKNVEITIS